MQAKIKDLLWISSSDTSKDTIIGVYETLAIEYIKTIIWSDWEDVFSDNSTSDNIVSCILILTKDLYDFHEWRLKKETVDWDTTEFEFNKSVLSMVDKLLSKYKSYDFSA